MPRIGFGVWRVRCRLRRWSRQPPRTASGQRLGCGRQFEAHPPFEPSLRWATHQQGRKSSIRGLRNMLSPKYTTMGKSWQRKWPFKPLWKRTSSDLYCLSESIGFNAQFMTARPSLGFPERLKKKRYILITCAYVWYKCIIVCNYKNVSVWVCECTGLTERLSSPASPVPVILRIASQSLPKSQSSFTAAPTVAISPKLAIKAVQSPAQRAPEFTAAPQAFAAKDR